MVTKIVPEYLIRWIKELKINLPEAFFDELISKEDLISESKEAQKTQKIDNVIEAQKLIFRIAEQGKWYEIKQFGIKNGMLTQMEIKLFDIASSIPSKVPSDKESLLIMNAIHNLEDIGLQL